MSRVERGLQDDLDASVLVALAHSLDAPVDALLVRERRHQAGALPDELVVAISMLGRLTQAQQRQVAALLQAYVSSARDE